MKIQKSRQKARKRKAKELRELLITIQSDPVAMKQARKLVLAT